jgi:hypothetical protein
MPSTTSTYTRLKKTSYELVTGNKPRVSYFKVFGCKCFILNKRPRTSKFAPKVDEDILLGYGSNEHAYRIFNKTSSRVEVVVDVTFDESNSSQEEQVDSSVVGKEDPYCEAIKQLAIDDIRPQEDQATEEEDPQAVAAPISADVLDAKVQHTLLPISRVVVPHLRAAVPPLLPQQQLILLHYQG